METDSEKIKFLASIRRKSIKQLAEEIGMSYSGLYSALNNDTLKTSTLKEILKILNYPIDQFFIGIDPASFIQQKAADKEPKPKLKKAEPKLIDLLDIDHKEEIKSLKKRIRELEEVLILYRKNQELTEDVKDLFNRLNKSE